MVSAGAVQASNPPVGFDTGVGVGVGVGVGWMISIGQCGGTPFQLVYVGLGDAAAAGAGAAAAACSLFSAARSDDDVPPPAAGADWAVSRVPAGAVRSVASTCLTTAGSVP